MMSGENNHGFTLIELLVVIAIIGVLSTLIITAYTSARRQARDTVRLANVNTLYRALTFYLDKSGGFPASAGECLSDSVNVGQALIQDSNIILSIPRDPSWPTAEPTAFNGGATKDYAVVPANNFCYWYYSDSADQFYLSFYLEKASAGAPQGINIQTAGGLIN